MRAAWDAIAIVLLLNAAAVFAAVGWLQSGGRLNRERVDKAIELFRTTIDEEQQQAQQAAELEKEAEVVSSKQQWLESVKAGPQTIEDRLEQDTDTLEADRQRAERFRQDKQVLLQAMANYEKRIDSLRKQLDDQRKSFEAKVQQQTGERESEGFKKAVQLYEQSPPKQVKQMFADLVARGEADQVVTYLSAMQPRQAVGVLKQFKSEPEIKMAAQLIESLRVAGTQLNTQEPRDGN